MNRDKLLSALSLARRAGKLVMGFDAVTASVDQGETVLAVLAAGLSPKTEKEVRFRCARRGVEVVPAEFTLEEAALVLGRRSGVFGVTDDGFRQLIRGTV